MIHVGTSCCFFFKNQFKTKQKLAYEVSRCVFYRVLKKGKCFGFSFCDHRFVVVISVGASSLAILMKIWVLTCGSQPCRLTIPCKSNAATPV